MRARSIFLALAFGWGAATGWAAAPQVQGPSNAALLPPSPPPAKSPVDLFRELLAMPPALRPTVVTNRPIEVQRRILAKVREYESLSPNERELKLRVTDLRWYLLPLMNTPATNRTARLESIPGEMRRLVAERLEQWDKLSPAMQAEIREQESTIRDVTETSTHPEALNPQRRQELENRMQNWRSLPEAQRQRAFAQFNRFFGLTEHEKERALGTLSEPERRKIEQTIDSFARLSPADRARCINGLAQFTSMSVPERLQFLRNAERWKAMPPNQREAWAQWVNMYSLRPPLPPGMGSAPLPPTPPPPRPARTVATNSN